jgi:hypothetical protein
MPDYSDGKIYKLVSPSGLTYIGSTTQTLNARRTKHKGYYLARISGKEVKNVTSIQLFIEDPEDIEIILIEKFPCESKKELFKRERFYIESIKCVNKYMPFKEPEEKKISQKEYRDSHKEKSKVYNQKYREKNRDKVLAKKREYNEVNKDKINEKRNAPIECMCGSHYTDRHRARHFKTKRHLAFLESN